MKGTPKLLNKNFFLLWQGQSISHLGTQGFIVAMLFWVKHATDSATLIGLMEMFSMLPAILLSPIGGAFADRHSRRKIIILSDVARSLAVLSLAGLIFLKPDATREILIWLFVVSLFNALITAFFEPAISASIPDLVPKERLVSANSLAQLSFQLTVFVGQGLGGTLFRVLGAPVLFLVDGLTYLFAAGSETFITIPQTYPERHEDSRARFGQFKQDIAQGMRYVWNRRGLREMVMISAILAFFTSPVIILLPFYVEDVLKVKTDWYGFILASYGLGTMLGYLFSGVLRLNGKARGRLMMVFIVLQSSGYGILGLVTNAPVALIMAGIGGFTGGFVTVNITTIMQITTPGEMRGRVFGLLAAITSGLVPLAYGLAGIIADLLNKNIQIIYIACGLIMGILTLSVSANREYRNFLAYDAYDADEEVPVEAKETVVSILSK